MAFLNTKKYLYFLAVLTLLWFLLLRWGMPKVCWKCLPRRADVLKRKNLSQGGNDNHLLFCLYSELYIFYMMLNVWNEVLNIYVLVQSNELFIVNMFLLLSNSIFYVEMFYLPKLQTAFGFRPLLRRAQRRHLLQRLLRQKLRRKRIRLRMRGRILAMQRCVITILISS